MTDLFEEVEEQLRSERYRQLARRFAPWMIGLAATVLAITLAYWGWDTYQQSLTNKASESYANAVDAYVAGDKAKARLDWTEIAKSGSGGYKSLALMHLAAFALEEKKPAEAVKLFDQAAAAAPDEIIADTARLKSAFALLDTAPLTEVEGRLKPLLEDGRPYRVQAREALAFVKLRSGDLNGARGEYTLVAQSLDASEGARARAEAAKGLIDSGSAKAVAAVALAAASLPPPIIVPPGAVIGAPQQPQASASQ